jgi:hypothetical protein
MISLALPHDVEYQESIVKFNLLLDVCREKSWNDLIKAGTVDAPLLENFFDIPCSFKLPDAESIFKPLDTPLTTESYTFNYLDVSPAELPCSQSTILIREEYKTIEQLLRPVLEMYHPRQPPDCALNGSPGIGLLCL